MKKILLKIWPFLTITLVVFIFFWKVFLLGQVPIPGDFIVGVYYPWLDYKWGYQVGVPVKNPVTSDVVSIVYPLRSYAVDRLKNGHLPLWNPFMFAGTPILADFQVGVFSPTMPFYFIFPKIWAWSIQVMMQPVLAATFTYLLLRNFGLEKVGSLFGGLFYAFSAFGIIWMEWNANTLVAAFIPLLILLMDKFINSNRLYWGVLLSICICLQILSGYPQLVVYSIMALFALMIFRIKKINKIKVVQIAFFMIAGFFLSAVLTLPGSEFVLNSQRKYGLLEPELIYLPWQNLITFLAPDYFGNPATTNYFGIGNYTLNAGYSGVVALILAIIGTLKNWGRVEVKYFLALLSMALILALPTPFAKAIFNSPIPAISASSNTRILVLANLAISLLAGFGISSLFNKEKVTKLGAIFIPLIVLITVSTLTVSYGSHPTISLRNLVLPIGFTLITITFILVRNKVYKIHKLRITLVLVVSLLAVSELFRYGWKYTPFSSPKLVFPETPVLSYFKSIEKPFRVSPGNVIPMNMWVPYNLESISGYDAMYPIWWARLIGAIDGHNAKLTTFGYYAPFELYSNNWFDLLNNKYLLVIKSSQSPNDWPLIQQVQKMKKFKEVFQDKSVSIFKNNNVYPRAFFVTDWEVKTDEETLLALMDPTFPLDKKIIIGNDVYLEKSKLAVSEVVYNLYSPEKSILSVKTDKEGFLFVSDAWYPGWEAIVDGRKVDIERANYAFRAVPLLKGEHVVEFIYDPASLKIGKIVSFLTGTLLIVVLIYDANEKHKKILSK